MLELELGHQIGIPLVVQFYNSIAIIIEFIHVHAVYRDERERERSKNG